MFKVPKSNHFSFVKFVLVVATSQLWTIQLYNNNFAFYAYLFFVSFCAYERNCNNISLVPAASQTNLNANIFESRAEKVNAKCH